MTQRCFFSQATSHRPWLLEVLSQVRRRALKSPIMTALPRQVLCAVFKNSKKTSFGTRGDKYNETTCVCATDVARSWYFSVATLDNTDYRMRGWILTPAPPWPRQPPSYTVRKMSFRHIRLPPFRYSFIVLLYFGDAKFFCG